MEELQDICYEKEALSLIGLEPLVSMHQLTVHLNGLYLRKSPFDLVIYLR